MFYISTFYVFTKVLWLFCYKRIILIDFFQLNAVLLFEVYFLFIIIIYISI